MIFITVLKIKSLSLWIGTFWMDSPNPLITSKHLGLKGCLDVNLFHTKPGSLRSGPCNNNYCCCYIINVSYSLAGYKTDFTKFLHNLEFHSQMLFYFVQVSVNTHCFIVYCPPVIRWPGGARLGADLTALLRLKLTRPQQMYDSCTLDRLIWSVSFVTNLPYLYTVF